MPAHVKDYILDQGHLSNDGFISVNSLVNFWSAPQNMAMTQRVDICGAAWYLALLYLRLGFLNEARALTINGAFIHQCITTSIEYIVEVCASKDTTDNIMVKLARCAEGFYATESPEKMESFIQRYLPPDYQKTMTTFANLSTRTEVMGYVNQISDDFHSTSSKKHPLQLPKVFGTEIRLAFVNNGDAEDNGGSKYLLNLLSSLPLKPVFSNYAEQRGVSLRSLRFSYKDKTLFLSQIGKKTPEELCMQNNDVIMVHDTSNTSDQPPQETRRKGSSSKNKSSSSKQDSPRHRGKKEKKVKKVNNGHINRQRTQEELKIEHSKALTKLHEELQPKLRLIRQCLNNLLIERSQPKSKSRRHSNRAPSPTHVDISCMKCLSGKAGKSNFMVHVGEVENLYKTRNIMTMHNSSSCTPMLDLHGYTRDEALQKLDDNLHAWVEAAMKGAYPFVIQVQIISGCGNQIVSEAVEQWIRRKKNVAIAPKKR